MTATIWNSADKTAGVTLSGASLIATMTSGGFGTGVRGTTAQSAGKFYLEFQNIIASSTVNNCLGLSQSGIAFTAGNGNAGGLCALTGNNGINGGNPKLGSFVGTNVHDVCLAFDATALLAWFRLDNGQWNADILANQNPATGTGGFSMAGLTGGLYPYAEFGSVNDTVTLALLAASWTQAAPAGFGPWDGLAVVGGGNGQWWYWL